MSEHSLDKQIKDVTRDQLANAIADATDVPADMAFRLAKMYVEYEDHDKEATLRDVLDNLEVDADIEVRE